MQFLPESNDKSNSCRLQHDEDQVKDVLQQLGELNAIFYITRLGKFKAENQRPRTVMMKFSNDWVVRKCLAMRCLLNDYRHRVFISRSLSTAELVDKKAILKKRYELIQAGTTRKKHSKIQIFKIQIFKLFLNGLVVSLDE